MTGQPPTRACHRGSVKWENDSNGSSGSRPETPSSSLDSWAPLPSSRRRAVVLAAALGFLLGASLVYTFQPRGPGRLLLRMRVRSSVRPLSAQAGADNLPQYLRQPWARQLLPSDALMRGLGPLGSGARMARLANKLLTGQPVTVVTLGGSVTHGAGATWWGTAYPALFFDWLQKSFPDSNMTVLNRAIPATTSGLSGMCSERLLPPDTDLAVVEFTQNDPPFPAMLHTPIRLGPEMLIRKVLRMRQKPAVALLHHYSWWFSKGDGWEAGLYTHPSTEADFTTLATYYDCPSLSLRAAVHPLMRRDTPGFKVDKVTGSEDVNFKDRVADPDKKDDYFYADGIHPSDTGHRALADLLIALVQQAVAAAMQSSKQPPVAELPPPLQSGVVDAPTSLCLLQEDFKSAVVRSKDFAFRPEKPNATTFVGQKWGWTGTEAGAWAELLIDTRAGSGSQSGGSAQQQLATVYLGYVRSWQRMGKARVECVAGCKCETATVNGSWDRKVTLQQQAELQVSQHKACRLRVMILHSTDSAGHKFTLNSIMVSTIPLTNNAPESQQEALMAG